MELFVFLLLSVTACKNIYIYDYVSSMAAFIKNVNKVSTLNKGLVDLLLKRLMSHCFFFFCVHATYCLNLLFSVRDTRCNWEENRE